MKVFVYSTIFSIFAMSKKKKLIKRFSSLPSDFTFEELVRLFAIFGFELSNKGMTSGSRVEFINGSETFKMHKPHPGNIVRVRVLIEIYSYLYSNNHEFFKV